MKITKSIPALMITGLGAAAIALAPAAGAAPSGPTCVAVSGTATQCTSPGNAQISATPPPVNYVQQYPFFGPYSLIFHHGGGHSR